MTAPPVQAPADSRSLQACWQRARRRARLPAWLLLAMLLGACPPRQQAEPPLRILAPASLATVLPEVASAWQADGGGEVLADFDATSRMAARLAAGAPADLFFSADARWMDTLALRGLVRAETRVDLLATSLVAAVPAGARDRPSCPADLAATGGRIALADEQAPAGRYARQALAASSDWEAVRPRVVSGDNVRTVLAWIARGEVPVGVVFATDVRAEPRVDLAFTFPAGSHDAVVFPAAITTGATRPDGAAAFLSFCRGAGRGIFERAGFDVLAELSP